MNAPFTNGRELAEEKEADEWLIRVRRYLHVLSSRKKQQFDRRVSIGDLLSERADNAVAYGFGEGTTMYDNVLVIGQVEVGRHTWIGPGCILDGSGGDLRIGDHCSISAGVQIYTHQTVRRSVSMGVAPIDYAPTTIGNGVYLGPNVIVQMGVSIGDCVVVGANSFVNRDVCAGLRVFGNPARVSQSNQF
ncbi:MAG: acetyltransferase [Bradyrhizobiaceae bacterium PARB1]|jgi:acetyltransferase-like isoleucine patch superfamily enzyme|nr:MAG: acetyltransferase [Bradyrhizobiaceae bacterium PARB1]